VRELRWLGVLLLLMIACHIVLPNRATAVVSVVAIALWLGYGLLVAQGF
jgi:hypothetical protein